MSKVFLDTNILVYSLDQSNGKPCGPPHPPVELVGIEDCFGLSAACYDEILTHFGVTAHAVADAAMRLLQGNSSTKH